MAQADAEQGGETGNPDGSWLSNFSAAWRPAAGWVCTAALFYWFVLRDLIAWGAFFYGIQGDGPKPISLDYLTTVLFALLGLGALRTVEKVKGSQ